MTVDVSEYRARIGGFYGRSLILPGVQCLNSFDVLLWFSNLLCLSGDIESNPGPSSISTDSSDDGIGELSEDLFRQNFAVVHYNVQSLLPKLNQLYAELSHFDVITFSETWLSPDTSSNDILYSNYHAPFRKDRRDDSHGGVIMYVRNTIPAIRRTDLEPVNLECVWAELRLNGKRVLIGVFL